MSSKGNTERTEPDVRWRNVAAISATLTVAAFAGTLGVPAMHWVRAELHRRAEQPRPVLATPEETRAILQIVLARMQYRGVPPPPESASRNRVPAPRTFILSDRSLCFAREPSAAKCGAAEALIVPPELDPIASRKLREELVLANRTAQVLALDGIPGTRVVAQMEIDRILATDGWWQTFYQRFPETAGVVRIGRPVLSPDRAQALIVVSHQCDGLCGMTSIHLLYRSGTGWRIGNEMVLRAS